MGCLLIVSMLFLRELKMTDDDLVAQLAMILQLKAMEDNDDQDPFIVYAKAALDYFKIHYGVSND